MGSRLVPYPQYSYIFNNFEASGTTYYQGMQVQVEKRFTNGLAFLAGYTLSRLMDNTSSGFSSFTAAALNKYNQRPEWSISQANETNTFKMNGTYELPIGPGKSSFQQSGRDWSTSWRLAGWLDSRLRGRLRRSIKFRKMVILIQEGPYPDPT